MNMLSSLDDSVARSRAASAAPFGAALEHLAFPDVEPGEDQRWSTWPATIPSERGPEPRPDWLVTSAAAIDTELGIVKTGKEADLWLIERAVPGAPDDVPGNRSLLAAKRYRGADHRLFHRSAVYTEGRGTSPQPRRARRAAQGRRTAARSRASSGRTPSSPRSAGSPSSARPCRTRCR